MRWILTCLLTAWSAGAAGQTIQSQFYVSLSGVDAGMCIATSPCRTILYTVQTALASFAGGQPQQINIGPGTWNESVAVTGSAAGSAYAYSAPSNAASLVFSGSGANSTIWNGNAVMCGVLVANSGANVAVQNITMEAEGNQCQSVLYAQLGGQINVFEGVAFGPAYQAHLHAEDIGSQVQVWNDYAINAGASSHAVFITGGEVAWNPAPVHVTMATHMSFPGGFLSGSDLAVAMLGITAFSGGINPDGPLYVIHNGAVIDSGTVGCANIPGFAPPIVTAGAQCQ